MGRNSEFNALFRDAHRRYLCLKRANLLFLRAVGAFRNILISFGIFSLWSLSKSLDGQASLSLFFGVFAGLTLIEYTRAYPPLTKEGFARALEVMFPLLRPAPWTATYSSRENVSIEDLKAWQQTFSDFFLSLRRLEKKSWGPCLTSLILPLLLALLALSAGGLSPVRQSLNSVLKRLGQREPYPRLVVLQGQKRGEGDPPDSKRLYQLSPHTPTKLELLSPNLLQINLDREYADPLPIVMLSYPSGEGIEGSSFQSFLMAKKPSVATATRARKSACCQLTFSVDRYARLMIPSLFGEDPLAEIVVKKLPVPEVTLSTEVDLRAPWPDDQPLPVRVSVKTYAPLKLVQLRIQTGNQSFRELILRANDEKIFAWEGRYEFIPEPYLNADLAEVEIFVEATDRAIPEPLTGKSRRLLLQAESAYARYRKTLGSLQKLKGHLDRFLEQRPDNFPDSAARLADEALARSELTPFFDILDRVQISEFASHSRDLQRSGSALQTADLSYQLNEFLTEHEILDDRERDRDFFVAARALSRLLSRNGERRPATVLTAVDHLRRFLADRRKRWELRVSMLEEPGSLKSWPGIRDEKPFISAQNHIERLTARKKGEEESQRSALQTLSASVSAYRIWIEGLEAQEDADRQKKEMKRQRGLASAGKKLRKLQKRQGKISSSLDQAATRDQEQMAQKWPLVRLDQNTNLARTKKLEYEMRSLSPGAALRIRAAGQAMERALNAGNETHYVKAESYSDAAGRLLREAGKEGKRSGQSKRGRRRKRVSGDRYYGQSVHGGDLEISQDYQVDKRYREDVLNEVLDIDQGDENSGYLGEYLRKVVR